MFVQIEVQIWLNIQIDIIVENEENYFIRIQYQIHKRRKKKFVTI